MHNRILLGVAIAVAVSGVWFLVGILAESERRAQMQGMPERVELWATNAVEKLYPEATVLQVSPVTKANADGFYPAAVRFRIGQEEHLLNLDCSAQGSKLSCDYGKPDSN